MSIIDDATFATIPTAGELSDRVGLWLRQALELAESAENTQIIIAALRALNAYRQAPGFRLAIVGESKRGKSTLINALLQRNLIVTSAILTAPIIVSINAGPEEWLEVQNEAETFAPRALDGYPWDELIERLEANQGQPAVTRLQLTVQNSWLRAVDISLVEIPMLEQPSDYGAGVVEEALSQCDAAVMIVSAEQPFSMTEAALLQQELLGRQAVRILIVVSKLDSIPADQRPVAWQAVCERMERMALQIPVLPAYPLDPDIPPEHTLDAIRRHIEAMSAKVERREWRSRQVAGRLVNVLRQFEELATQAATAAHRSAQERTAEQSSTKAAAESAYLVRDALLNELDRRRLHLDEELRTRLHAAESSLVEHLTTELMSAPSTQQWWEQLPLNLKRAFASLSEELSGFLNAAVTEDVDWLQHEITARCGIIPKSSSTAAIILSSVTPQPGQPTLEDVQHRRLYTLIGGGTAALLNFVLLRNIPAAVMVGMGVGLASEWVFSQLANQQHQQLVPEISRVVDRALEKLIILSSAQLREFYDQLADDLRREQSSLPMAEVTKTAAGSEVLPERDWQRLSEDAVMLRHDIEQALVH